MRIVVGEEHEVASLQFDGLCGGEQARSAVAFHDDVEEHDVLGIGKETGVAMSGLRYRAPGRGEPGVEEYRAPQVQRAQYVGKDVHMHCRLRGFGQKLRPLGYSRIRAITRY